MSLLTSIQNSDGSMTQQQLEQNITNIIQELNSTTNTLSNSSQLTLFSDGSTDRYEMGYSTNGWGVNANVGIKASKPGVEVTTAADSQLSYRDDFATKLYNNVNGVWTVLEGLRTANSINGIGSDQYGFFVSQAGIDVRNATNAQLVFNSGQDILKIVETGTGVAPQASTGGGTGYWSAQASNKYAHGLGFIPIVMAYLDFTGFYVPLPWVPQVSGFAGATNPSWVTILAYADINNVYIVTQSLTLNSASSVGPYNVKYYLLQETAT